MSKPNRKSLSEWLQGLSSGLTAVLSFVSALVGFVKLWQGDAGLVTGGLLAAGGDRGWLGLAVCTELAE